MLEKRNHLARHGDRLRQLMLREPRGYPGLCANVLLPSSAPEADAGYVIMEQVEYPGMSGSNTICVATVLLESGMVEIGRVTTGDASKAAAAAQEAFLRWRTIPAPRRGELVRLLGPGHEASRSRKSRTMGVCRASSSRKQSWPWGASISA